MSVRIWIFSISVASSAAYFGCRTTTDDPATAGGSNLTSVAIGLPSTGAMPAAVASRMTGYHFKAASQNCASGSIEMTATYASARIEAKLSQACDYLLSLEIGTLTGNNLNQVLASNLNGSTPNGLSLPRSELQGKSSVNVKLVLQPTDAGRAAGLGQNIPTTTPPGTGGSGNGEVDLVVEAEVGDGGTGSGTTPNQPNAGGANATRIDFATQIDPILKKSCAGTTCHSSNSVMGKGFRFVGNEAQFRQAPLDHIEDATKMPPAGSAQISASDRELLVKFLRDDIDDEAAKGTSEFQTRINPIVRRSCAGAACHGDGTALGAELEFINKEDRMVKASMPFLTGQKPIPETLKRARITNEDRAVFFEYMKKKAPKK